jgi:mRNA interferase RelE/StbE
MTRYRLKFKRSAERAFLGLPRDVQPRLDKRLLALQDDPRPPGTKALAGETGLHRLQVGDYRVVYEVHDKEILVLVLAIGHRRETYRRR